MTEIENVERSKKSAKSPLFIHPDEYELFLTFAHAKRVLQDVSILTSTIKFILK